MPRALRVQYPGAIYNVMDRGDRQERIFVDHVDGQDWLKALAEASEFLSRCLEVRRTRNGREPPHPVPLPIRWGEGAPLGGGWRNDGLMPFPRSQDV